MKLASLQSIAEVLELHESGNLMLLDGSNTVIWQSFDSPTDTLLPGQALFTNMSQSLVSWQSADDWSEGYYLCGWVSIEGTSLTSILALSWNGKSIESWNHTSWSANKSVTGGVTLFPYLFNYPASDYIYLDPYNGSFYAGNISAQYLVMSSTSHSPGPLRRVTLDRDGGLRLYSWTLGTSTQWAVEGNWVSEPCGVYAECGPYGVCSPDPLSPAYLGKCSCPPDDFEFIDPMDPLKGCKPIFEFPLHSCITNTSKIRLKKVGDTDYPFANRLYPYINTTESACIQTCLDDCRCAGAVFWRRDGRCYIKSGPLFNGGYPQDVGNHSAYLKVLTSPLISPGRKDNLISIVSGIVSGAVIVVLVLVLIAWTCWKRRRERCQPMLTDQYLLGPRKFSLRELNIATKNFSQSELIGRGGMGSVYKGTLRPSGTVVAVKRIRHESKGGEQGFLAEASSISQIRHRNLVQLKGWCIEDNKFLLVYDYMPNGSLDQWLYDGRSEASRRRQRTGKDQLPWSLRYSIVTGIAAALAYLHEDWQQCVLHRDIKSSNVLLDAEFNAHLGDFGLARLIDHQKVEKTTLMAGTLGYMAPEMPFTGKATKETDVYSFGVLMLEVVCGKKPVDSHSNDLDMEPQDVVLLHKVWRAHEAGDILAAVDPRLRKESDKVVASERAAPRASSLSHNGPNASVRTNGDSSEPKYDKEGVDLTEEPIHGVEVMDREKDEKMRTLHLGLLCCLPYPNARPSMRLVHQILTGDVTAIPSLPGVNQFTYLDVLSAVRGEHYPQRLVSEHINSDVISTPSSL